MDHKDICRFSIGIFKKLKLLRLIKEVFFRYMDLKNSRYFDYRYFSEIQSHEPEFDHLKSIELDEKINALEFLNHNKSSRLQILSTNDRIIKLWKIENRKKRETGKSYFENGVL